MEGISICLAAGGADDVIGGGLVGILIQAAELPGAMAVFPADGEVLLDPEDIAIFPALGAGFHDFQGMSAAILQHPSGAGMALEEFHRVERGTGLPEIRYFEGRAGWEEQEINQDCRNCEKLHRFETFACKNPIAT